MQIECIPPPPYRGRTLGQVKPITFMVHFFGQTIILLKIEPLDWYLKIRVLKQVHICSIYLVPLCF